MDKAQANAKVCSRRWPGGGSRPGPSGSPARGRSDVLPTERNMFSVDPRRAVALGACAKASNLPRNWLRRHLQDHGDWPRRR